MNYGSLKKPCKEKLFYFCVPRKTNTVCVWTFKKTCRCPTPVFLLPLPSSSGLSCGGVCAMSCSSCSSGLLHSSPSWSSLSLECCAASNVLIQLRPCLYSLVGQFTHTTPALYSNLSFLLLLFFQLFFWMCSFCFSSLVLLAVLHDGIRFLIICGCFPFR